MMGLSINNNLGAMSSLSALNSNSNALNAALQQLSTGKRINSAADDAAGYAISQKMQGQINGLNQASQNAQDGISLIQTASGALNQTTSILQQMRTLAVQASNSTATNTDRQDLQTEFSQLASQINNIGNTTQFNTQSLLQGNGAANLNGTGIVTSGTLGTGGTSHVLGAAAVNTQVTQTATFTAAAVAGDTLTFNANGQSMVFTFAAAGSSPDAISNVTANGATINLASTPGTATTATDLQSAMQAVINANSTLKGNYTSSVSGSGVTLSATADGQFAGSAGSLAAVVKTGTVAFSGAAAAATGTTVNPVQASTTLDFSTASTPSALVGKGFTINGQEVQFYDGTTNGPYTGSAIGVDLGGATTAANVVSAITSQVGSQINGVTLSGSTTSLTLTATQGGTAGNSVAYSDGGVQKDFQANFQIGANTGQTMTVSIGAANAKSLGITAAAGTAGYGSVNNVNNGTNNTNVEASLDISTTTSADNAISTIDTAIQNVTTEQANLGAVQNRLTSSMGNLSSTSQNLTTAESGITDTNMAAEMTTFTQESVLQQAAVSMLAQAQQQPQLVLKLLQ